MSIKNILTVFKRECGAYFNSAIATIYLIVFVALTNGLFMTRFFLLGRADMRPFFENLPFVLFIFIPVLTMRLWAEDKKENTFELLMTFPMKPVEIVLGKFFAGFVFYATALLSTLVLSVLVLFVGRPDMGVILGGYLGGLLIGALYLAIGIFISGLTKEQIVAFVLTVISCFLVFFLGTDFFAMVLDGWVPGLGTFLMKTLGASERLTNFFKGVVNVTDVLYFVKDAIAPARNLSSAARSASWSRPSSSSTDFWPMSPGGVSI
jgi:ABC-2 type transport system permease protein